MKRRLRFLIRMIMFLLLGAIVNVAVAWGCVLINPGLTFGGEANGSDLRYDLVINDDEWLADAAETERLCHNVACFYAIRYSRTGQGVCYANFSPPWLKSMQSFVAHEVRAGWPFLSMAGGWVIAWPSDCESISNFEPRWIATLNLSSEWNLPQQSRRAIPLLPIWRGFTIGTLIYTVILWLLLAFPFKVRRRRRIKRGLCPACAYPVGTSPVCTECGKPVAPRSVEPS